MRRFREVNRSTSSLSQTAIAVITKSQPHNALERDTSLPEPTARQRFLRNVVEHSAHFLPAQGPITQFVHHNTLHAFEEYHFDEAVKRGARLFGCEPYASEQRFRDRLARKRIRIDDLKAALRPDLGDRADEQLDGLCTRLDLRMAMLEHPVVEVSGHELRWLLDETGALKRFSAETPASLRKQMVEETRRWVLRDSSSLGVTQSQSAQTPQGSPTTTADAFADPALGLQDLVRKHSQKSVEAWDDRLWESFTLSAVWRLCLWGARNTPPADYRDQIPVRHRDFLMQSIGQDIDDQVNGFLVRFCAAFLDQGIANWPLPNREAGMFAAFIELYRQPLLLNESWQHGLSATLSQMAERQVTPLESIEESLQVLGVEDDELEDYVTATLLALRGWAGMIWQMETRADRAAIPAPPGSLIEFLAVRLILERFALEAVRETQCMGCADLRQLRQWTTMGGHVSKQDRHEQTAYVLFQLGQLLGWRPEQLISLSQEDWRNLVEEVQRFDEVERRRVFFLAFEHRFQEETLDAIANHNRNRTITRSRPKFQMICCIDDREESFRRHLEEVEPDCETIGAAGFFAVAMYYRGSDDAHYAPLCPVVITPNHYVREEVLYSLQAMNERRVKTRRVLGTASHRVHLGTRSFAGGAALTAMFGAMASVPLVARILFPRLTARIRRSMGSLLHPAPLTQLSLERIEDQAADEGTQLGFTVDEMTEIVQRLLHDMGLIQSISRLVIVCGHGSSSMNNPHRAAYDCGACAGAKGGPNARAFARMANDSRVRSALAKRGLNIPADTVFLGAYHNTCDEGMTYFDLDLLPVTHRRDFEAARDKIDVARERNAHERCRRFESAPLNLTEEAALKHVEGRAEDMAQVRPECGHATNAICLVGRRWRSRDLFLDRRAFLTSYDPTQDDETASILTRILQAVVPVCAGINLEYYFSFVDSGGWGCGTKLPHNISGLLGVMDGAASDLRPGLPWQMVELHEEVRLLFVIETTPQKLQRIFDANPAIATLCCNDWVQVATLDPHSNEIHVLRHGTFEQYRVKSEKLPSARSSADWYRGWRDNLSFAKVLTEVAGDASPEPVFKNDKMAEADISENLEVTS